MGKNIEPHYDNLIIGFGKGGKTLAAWLAKKGQQVALVEMSNKMYGGSCINVACIPTKTLIKKAEEKVPYQKAYGLKNDLTSFLRELNYEKIEELPAAAVITGKASFVSPNEVLVKIGESKEEKRITADRIFINTGSKPFVPPIPGIDTVKNVYTSISLLEQSRLPEKLVIIGGGFIGLEFADMYAKFGAEVTVLDSAEEFLPKEDKDVAEEVFKVLTGRKINIVTAATVQKIENTDHDKVRVEYKKETGETVFLEASALLVATGRKPMTEGLNLEAAGIKTDKKGYIEVDASLKTNVPNIWAMGDINGGPQFTYISLDDFRIIRDQLSEAKYTSVEQRKLVASSVFITPPLAHIGLREREALEKGYEIKVAKLPAASVVRARIDGDTSGLLKTVVDTKTNKILGCTLFCTGANEMINTIQVAINCGLDYKEVRDTIYTHPSMAEAFNDLYAQI
ncbi:FAD-dependent oxidoreductase [Rufibacter glacialis]|uniref:FAD-dependent oxidoreductase n=1 Tax=Rufibacter glacialis TaxID=1259555 RepID=A0A5M8QT01_9BACT|nr:FAD-dependent oxidoreductase [Rufibacter glacialis]KAA6438170.1 SidA/IucD/PvdA family monooxygenase [Rufibacter glacialis]GGK89198.1 pyridine nucleotide-disulfide oxidoreductase [Rufibacter glacialis]